MPATVVTLNGLYDTITATDLDGNGVDDLVLYRRSSAVDYVSFGTGDRALHLVQMSVSGDHQLLRGDFTGSAAGDVLWVDLGTPADALLDRGVTRRWGPGSRAVTRGVPGARGVAVGTRR